MATDNRKVKELLSNLEKKMPKLAKGFGWSGWKIFVHELCTEEHAKILAQVIELLLIQQDRIETLEQELEELKKR